MGLKIRNILLLILWACTAVSVHAQKAFKLPEIPAVLQTPQDRADYLVQHYWDLYDFQDTTLLAQPEVSEQAFSNFLSILPYAPQTSVEKGITTLMDSAQQRPASYRYFSKLAEKYLYEPNSPLHNEEFYIPFLQHLVKSSLLTETDKTTPKFRLEMAMKNRVGTTATDLLFETRQGRHTSLKKTVTAPLTLLIFYDPDCDNCIKTQEQLKANTALTEMIRTKQLAVIALYAEGNRKEWDRTKAAMPAAWTVACDESHIDDHQLYDLKAMPTLYLLDAHLNILLKDTTPEKLATFLAAKKGQK
jgi:hypothetical protein